MEQQLAKAQLAASLVIDKLVEFQRALSGIPPCAEVVSMRETAERMRRDFLNKVYTTIHSL